MLEGAEVENMNKSILLKHLWNCYYNDAEPLMFTNDDCYNISAKAIRSLAITDNEIEFIASFNGTPQRLSIPMDSIIGLDSINSIDSDDDEEDD